MRLITVTAPGVHVRNDPEGIGDTPKNWFDKLAPGDQLAYIRTSDDGEWYYGRVVRIVSGLYLDSRLNRCGWVHKDGVRLDPEKPGHPPPLEPLPTANDWWKFFAIVAVVMVPFGVLLYGCAPH